MVEQKQRRQGLSDGSEEVEVEYYSYISIDKIKSHISIAIAVTVLFIFATLIMNMLINGSSWTQVIAPVFLIGCLLTFIPPSEQWVYKHWQSRPERYEAGNQER